MEIADSARKHGVADLDIEHAVTHALRAVVLSDDQTSFIGPDTATRLLEIIALDVDSDNPIAIHAMALRPTFYRHL